MNECNHAEENEIRLIYFKEGEMSFVQMEALPEMLTSQNLFQAAAHIVNVLHKRCNVPTDEILIDVAGLVKQYNQPKDDKKRKNRKEG